MGNKQSISITANDTKSGQSSHHKEKDVFCVSTKKLDESSRLHEAGDVLVQERLDGVPHLHENSFTTELLVKERQNGTISKHQPENKSTQTDEPMKEKKKKKEKILQEKQSSIQAMTGSVDRLYHVCRTSGMAPLVDDGDCSMCPEDFIRNLRYIEKLVINQNSELSRLTFERDSALNRLSSVAGDKLTTNNPNITDLNDNKRPIKLAEMYKTLYDNEWTDAIEILETKHGKSEENDVTFVYHLYSVIKAIYRTCSFKSTSQMEILAEQFFMLQSPSEEQIGAAWIDHPSVHSRIIECRKNAADGVILNLQATLADDGIFLNQIVNCDPALSQNILEEVVATDYFRKCVEICWRFVIHDPPVYLETEPLKGCPLDKNIYTEFSKAGKVIHYVVWPALYLYKDDKTLGPLLSKGVVQPK